MKTIVLIGRHVQHSMMAVDLLGLHPNQCLWVQDPDQLQGVNKKIVFLLDGWDSECSPLARTRMIEMLKHLVGLQRIQLFNLNLDQL